MSSTDDLLARNRDFVAQRSQTAPLEARPTLPVAIVTCMDARVEPGRMLGLQEGEAHVIRNAGATVTDDVIRSLAISQVILGTREVMLIKHTDCGLRRTEEGKLRTRLVDATGVEPAFPLGTFREPDEAVRDELLKIRESQLLVDREGVRGFVFDVKTGHLKEIL